MLLYPLSTLTEARNYCHYFIIFTFFLPSILLRCCLDEKINIAKTNFLPHTSASVHFSRSITNARSPVAEQKVRRKLAERNERFFSASPNDLFGWCRWVPAREKTARGWWMGLALPKWNEPLDKYRCVPFIKGWHFDQCQAKKFESTHALTIKLFFRFRLDFSFQQLASYTTFCATSGQIPFFLSFSFQISPPLFIHTSLSLFLSFKFLLLLHILCALF